MVKKKTVRVLVFSGYGLNCEEEAAYGFTLAGAESHIVHINDVIARTSMLREFDILCFPGGFAYGDDTGSGKAYGNRVKNHLGKELEKFIASKKLVIGICNGFQILTQLGILPGALTFNDNNRYTDRWVDMKVENDSPWLIGITHLPSPIAHGEGKYYADTKTLAVLKSRGAVALRYTKGEMSSYQGLPSNPNGALDNIAGVTAHDGRVLGLMPHPDRALFFTQLPNWHLKREIARRSGVKTSSSGPGLAIFKNGVQYASEHRTS